MNFKGLFLVIALIFSLFMFIGCDSDYDISETSKEIKQEDVEVDSEQVHEEDSDTDSIKISESGRFKIVPSTPVKNLEYLHEFSESTKDLDVILGKMEESGSMGQFGILEECGDMLNMLADEASEIVVPDIYEEAHDLYLDSLYHFANSAYSYELYLITGEKERIEDGRGAMKRGGDSVRAATKKMKEVGR